MTLTYFIGDDYHDDSFEYECDLEDFIETLSKEELVNFVYETIDSNIITSWKLPSNDEELRELLNNDEELLRDLVNEYYNELYDWFEEEIKDFFYDDAIESYGDSQEYARDPYTYCGVSRKDFY